MPGTESAASPWTRQADLDLALRLADAADVISLPRFRASDLQVSAKPDLTPVSDADLAVERAIRSMLAAERPQDAIVGEEFGDSDASSPGPSSPGGSSSGGSSSGGSPSGGGRRWVLDPIDGTKNFVRGVPIWATLIALFEGDDAVVGVVSAPALNRRWWAATGLGAFGRFGLEDPRRCRVSAVGELSDASLSFSELSEWRLAGLEAQFTDLAARCWRTRAYGDFYSYMLVAEGAVDIAAEPELSLWDVAALIPIVTEAGGTLTAIDGQPSGGSLRSALASNGLLHPAGLALLNR